jgi:hypothetical protein
MLKLKSKLLNVIKGFYCKFSFSLDKGGYKLISTHVRMWVRMLYDVYVYDVYPHPGTHPVRHARSMVVIKVAASYSTVLACIIYLKWVDTHIAHNITRQFPCAFPRKKKITSAEWIRECVNVLNVCAFQGAILNKSLHHRSKCILQTLLPARTLPYSYDISGGIRWYAQNCKNTVRKLFKIWFSPIVAKRKLHERQPLYRKSRISRYAKRSEKNGGGRNSEKWK